MNAEAQVQSLVSRYAGVPATEVLPAADLHRDLGVASLDLVLLREDVERQFGVIITDDEVQDLVSVDAIVAMLGVKKPESVAAAATSASPAPVDTSGPPRRMSPHLTTNSYLERDHLYSDLEVGMPLTGRNNLAETPLLREIGHLRWQHTSALSGVGSKDVVDDEGERLYPTFFFVEVAFPPAKPMATYRENDRFTVVSTLRRFGRSMLDGEHYLFPADGSAPEPPATPEAALEAGVPYLRLSNSFVMQWKGAGWLKKSRPVDPGFERIPETVEPPSTGALVKEAQSSGTFMEVPDDYVPLSDGFIDVEYDIVPDRDLNGAGLLYFANYPAITDVAERTVLRRLGFAEGLIDQRTLAHRKTGYYSNASAEDRLKVGVEVFVQDPDRAGVDADMMPVRLLINYRMERMSDDRLMVISSAKKLVMGTTFDELSLRSAGGEA